MMQHAANYIDKATSQGQALTSVAEGFLALIGLAVWQGAGGRELR